LSVFYCGASAEDVKIAPIRSVRVYFVDWAQEYGIKPLFVHIGGANNICRDCPGGVKSASVVAPKVNAFNKLEKLGWRGAKGNAFDGGTNVGYPIIIRDQYRLGDKSVWEHAVVGFTDKIYDEAKNRGLAFKGEDGDWNETFTSWKFKDEATGGSAGEISFDFWSNKGDYDVSWKYNPADNSYLRFNGGKEHIDHETKIQLAAKNVVVQFVDEEGPVDSEGHMFYTLTGKGDAIIFQNGQAIEGSWEKKAQDARTIFKDEKGIEISFVRGQIWIEAVPDGNDVDY